MDEYVRIGLGMRDGAVPRADDGMCVCSNITAGDLDLFRARHSIAGSGRMHGTLFLLGARWPLSKLEPNGYGIIILIYITIYIYI